MRKEINIKNNSLKITKIYIINMIKFKFKSKLIILLFL